MDGLPNHIQSTKTAVGKRSIPKDGMDGLPNHIQSTKTAVGKRSIPKDGMDGLPNHIQSPREEKKFFECQSFYYRRGNS